MEVNNSFTPYTIVAGEPSVLSVKIFNLNPFPLNDAFWIDYLPAGIYLDDLVDSTIDCGGAIDATPGKERSFSSASGT